MDRVRRIPILRQHDVVSPTYVMRLAKSIDSDGCTGVTELYHSACVIHDLAYRFGIDPWGQRVTRAEADRMFRQNIQAKSPVGLWSPVSWIRWVGVRLFGARAYRPQEYADVQW